MLFAHSSVALLERIAFEQAAQASVGGARFRGCYTASVNKPAAVTQPNDHGAAVTAGFLGWTLDAFDFFLVTLCLTAIGREFHKSDSEMALSITATLAFRPIGAFLFGLMA